MRTNTRRNFFGKIAALAAFVSSAPKLFAQQAPASGASPASPTPAPGNGPSKKTRLDVPAANTTYTMGSIISPALARMTDIPKKITCW